MAMMAPFLHTSGSLLGRRKVGLISLATAHWSKTYERMLLRGNSSVNKDKWTIEYF